MILLKESMCVSTMCPHFMNKEHYMNRRASLRACTTLPHSVAVVIQSQEL
jgi:hypothetical protein